jgi:hypothetical protein
MEYFLGYYGLDHVINGSMELNPRQDSLVYPQILNSLQISENMTNKTKELANANTQISKITSGRKAWMIMREIFEKQGTLDAIYAAREIMNLQYDGTTGIENYISKIFALNEDLMTADESMAYSEKQLLGIILTSLPEHFSPVVASLQGIKDLTINLVKQRLKDHELQNNSKRSKILMTKGKEPESDLKRKRSKFISGPQGERPLKGDNPSYYCRNCKAYGHKTTSCYSLKKAKVNNLSIKTTRYYIDSGASKHVVNNSSLFSIFQKDNTIIELADNSQCICNKKGMIQLIVENEEKRHEIILHDVLFSDAIKDNLISVAELTKQGYSCIFENNYVKIEKDNVQLYKAYICKTNSLYELHAISGNVDQINTISVNMAITKENSLSLWHKRLGHPNLNVTKDILSKNSISFTDNLNVCEACQLGKLSMLKFENSNSRANNILETLHVDLMGPMRVTSIDDALYRLTIIDDKSRYEWNYLLKYKSEAPSTLMFLIKKVETEFSTPSLTYIVKRVRSDNGGEFITNKLIAFLEDKGIEQQFTLRYTPQQNGIAERRNRTTMECARTLLYEAKLSHSFWGPAINAAT